MHLADGVVTNERLSRLMDTSDEWISQRTGIRERRFARKGTSSVDLGAAAARNALEDAGLAATDVDLIVFATMTPAHYFPGNGGLLASQLGLSTTHALDIRMQCAGFLSGLQVADAFIRSGTARRVLLVGAECHAAFFPWSDADWAILFGESSAPASPESFAWGTAHRDRAVLFGDAAGAFVLEAHEAGDGRGFLGFEMRTDGNHWDKLHVPGGGSASFPYFSPAMFAANGTIPIVEGRQVYRLATTAMPQIVREVLERERARAGRPLAAAHAPGQPAHQRGRSEGARASRRQGVQQHPEVREHDGRDTPPRLSRGEAAGPDSPGRPRRIHRARRGPPLGRRASARLAARIKIS